MRAAVQHRYGPPSVVTYAEIGLPRPGPGDVLVKVGAASVHPGDYFILTGVPYVLRPVLGLRGPRLGVRGFDLAGRVAAVGRNARRFRPGDEVFGWTSTGSLAEYVCAGEDNFAPKSYGAQVTGVCSTRNVDLVRSLGADHVIDYTREDFTRSGQLYDVILDNVEAQPLSAIRRVLAPAGTLVLNSGRGGRWIGPLGRWAKAGLRSPFARQTLRPLLQSENQQDPLILKELIEGGAFTPVIDRSYPLGNAAQALAYVGVGHTRGKVVITV